MLTLSPFARAVLSSSIVLAGWFAGACRASAPPHPELTGCHPACPGGSTAAIGDAGAHLRGESARAIPTSQPRELAPSSAAYLCPMHLHVGSDEAGRCPECNMKLVPRAEIISPEVREHDHGQ